jgi:3-deoxy-D-manno-octulosonic-acid transferase
MRQTDKPQGSRWLSRLGWLLYEVMAGGLCALALPWLAVRRGGHYRPTLRPRLGLQGWGGSPRATPTEPPGAGGVWIHAVSVGEVGVAATLARALPEALPLLVTTVTPTGQALARKVLGNRARIAYFPFEVGWAVRRFVRRLAPRVLIVVEGDLWPLVLREVRHRGIPVAVVNGRMSDRNFGRLRRVRVVLGSLPGRLLLEPVDRFGAQTEVDAERWRRLGVPPERLRVTGNLKYETPEPPPVSPSLVEGLKRWAAGRPLLLAGSTMAGEEGAVLDALARLGTERALLVLAPRHPERCPEVVAQATAAGFRVALRSALTDGSPTDRMDLVVLDTLGELAGLYRLAVGAFIGGTLVPTGGHNPLEAARFAVPVVVGPSMHNFREMAGHFDAAAAWRRVADAAMLAEVWRQWLDDREGAAALGNRGRALIDAHRGAVERTVALLEPLLEGIGG